MAISESELQANEDADDFISDESSFYGDEETRASLEQEVAAFDPSSYWSSQNSSLSAIAAANLAAKSPPPTNKPLYNPYEGDPSARQLAESIPEFLSRLPPLTTPVGKVGSWIQIANPYSTTRPLSQDLGAFTTVGTRILESLSTAIAAKETALVGRPKTLLNRQVTQLRTTATEQLLDTARGHGVTTGKWMLFPLPEDVNAVWQHVADATASGQLGSGAKVATDNGIGDGRPRLICVYTENFSYTEDVKRVLNKLATMGLVHKKGDPRGIYYKCDAFTHLGIDSKNEWGLKASLYAAKDLLAKKSGGKGGGGGGGGGGSGSGGGGSGVGVGVGIGVRRG